MAISKLAARGVLVHRVEADALVAGLGPRDAILYTATTS
jgi:hypothetical protein